MDFYGFKAIVRGKVEFPQPPVSCVHHFHTEPQMLADDYGHLVFSGHDWRVPYPHHPTVVQEQTVDDTMAFGGLPGYNFLRR